MQMLSLHLRPDLPVCILEAGCTVVRLRLQAGRGLHLLNSRQTLKSETSVAVRSPESAARTQETGYGCRGDLPWNILSVPRWR